MPNDVPLASGLKPTIRQLMILIVWAALLSAIVRAALVWGIVSLPPDIFFLLASGVIGFWPMAFLVILVTCLDRPGSVRRWYVSCCSVAGSFLGSACMMLLDPIFVARTGRPTAVFPMIFLCGLGCLVAGVMNLRTLWPGRCAGCGGLAVIPTRKLVSWKPADGQLREHGWCALCGMSYARVGRERWTPRVVGADERIIRRGFLRAIRNVCALRRRPR